MLKKWIFIIFFPFSIFSLEQQPWFGDVFEFHFLGSYTYSRFSSVQAAIVPLRNPSNDHLLYFGLDFSFTPQWTFDWDLQFTETPRQSFSFRSTAWQFRYLWLDDIIGDLVSLSTGANIRYTSSRSIHDISTPYPAPVDFELNFSVGKEFDYLQDWRFRFWGFGALGQGSRGSPWLRATLAFEGNYYDEHKWALFSYFSHGFGRKTTVNIANFNGYARIRQKSIDIGASYGFRMLVYGTIRVSYVRRVLAKRCPSRVNFFTLSYLLPFSF